MKKPLVVKDGISWVGALDFDIRVFDVIMYTQNGTTYNSYVVKGTEKTALVEVVKEKFFDEFIERLRGVTDPGKIDYIILNHTEPDHSGGLAKLLELCPDAEVVATAVGLKFARGICNRDFKSRAVRNGDSIDLGGAALEFMPLPQLHWPDSMFTYIPQKKTLFTCDSFGCHYCGEAVFNDAIDKDFADAYKYYFDCIMGPFKSFVRKALDAIAKLEIETICNGHGPVIRKDVEKYITMYREWSAEPAAGRPSVVVAYVTSYGYTKMLAEKITEGIEAAGGIDAQCVDITDRGPSAIASEIEASRGVLLGSPTIVGDALAPVWELLTALNPVVHGGRIAGAFGSYGWSGEAVPNIMQRFAQLRFKTPLEGLRVNLRPTEADLVQAFEYGKKFAAFIPKGA
ncbi:MAG: FprA family A-type flavoprotein [Clostridiales bacterium]|nr:FprA family A-type flavoprotein [Clostridiales bacterium]